MESIEKKIKWLSYTNDDAKARLVELNDKFGELVDMFKKYTKEDLYTPGHVDKLRIVQTMCKNTIKRLIDFDDKLCELIEAIHYEDFMKKLEEIK